MKITCIRIKGKIPSTDVILEIEKTLRRRITKAGFITEVNAITRTSIKIGLHMRSFKLDVTVHDRNLRCNPHLPNKLTDTPTWDQRVEFNDIVNAVLNKFKVSANVKSGPFIIRAGTKAMTEYDWHAQKPEYIRHNEMRGYSVEPIDEQAFLKARRLKRLEQARQKRAKDKQREEQKPHLILGGA